MQLFSSSLIISALCIYILRTHKNFDKLLCGPLTKRCIISQIWQKVQNANISQFSVFFIEGTELSFQYKKYILYSHVN